tara:strand:- start:134 stop:712 length:579 start_codon:yes stop_codon:yes gene_type:complete
LLNSSYKVERTTEAAQPAVSVCDLQGQVSLDDSSYDDLLEAYELSARQYIETQTGRILTLVSYTLYMNTFPDLEFYFPNGPVITIDSIEYLVSDVWTTVPAATYKLGRGNLMPQDLKLKVSQSWPTDVDAEEESIRINYTVGAVNQLANQAIKLMVAHWFENREAVVVGMAVNELPMAVQSIIRSLKSYAVR